MAGSWIAGHATCQRPACAALITQGLSPEAIQLAECDTCATDRRSRILVAQGDADSRFQNEFSDAVAIFGTNDINITSTRSAPSNGQNPRTPTVFICGTRSCFGSGPPRKAESDGREIAVVAATRQGMRWAVWRLAAVRGHACSGHRPPRPQAWNPERHQGLCSRLVCDCRCDTCTRRNGVQQLAGRGIREVDTATSWQISGVPDANVYPVVTCRRVWYLDRQRRSPKLRVSRTQFPLAPQFAITAHVAQGQTIKEGVTTDLCIGPRGNPFTVYVAITRVQGREKLLIFRPFDAAPFQKGIGLGRDLLLRHLRREPINWQDLLAKYCEERACSTCAERKPSTAFTAGQWKRDDKDRVCRECTKHYADAGTPWQCNVCKLWHVETNFPEKHRQRQCSFFRVCLTCEAKKPCFKCGVPKPEKEYGPAAWKARNADRRCCRDCVQKLRGHWSCAECLERKPHAEFTAWRESRDASQNGRQCCNTCISLALVCQIARRANKRLTPLRRREQSRRQQAIIDEVRQEILERTRQITTKALTQEMQSCKDRRPECATGSVSPAAATASAASQEDPCPPEPDVKTKNGKQKRWYQCPFCQQQVKSTVETGQINHSFACGKFFRVVGGFVTGRIHKHACPTCATIVYSEKAAGQIKARHRNSAGRTCRRESWNVTATLD